MKKIILLLFVIFSSWQINAQVSAYSFSENLGTYTEISAGATLLSDVRADSFLSTAQNIGFNFIYDGVTYTQFKMSSNGFISFNMTGTSSLTTNNFSTANATSRPIIGPLWDDLDGGDIASSIAGYEVSGTSPNRVLTVEWRNWQWNYTVTTNPTISFQVKLYETTGVIEFVYRQEIANVGSGSASIGIGSATSSGSGTYLNLTSVTTPVASSSTSVTNIATKPATGQIYRFTPPVPCTGTPTPGTVAPTVLTLCNGSSPGNLVLSGFSSGVSGLTFQWQQSPDGVAWVDAVGGTGATTATYAPPVYSGTPIQYRARVTCTTSGLFDFSSVTLIGNAANPTTQVTNGNAINLSGVSAGLNWTNGNGLRRMVVLSDTATFVDPINGNAPALVAAAAYSGAGQQIMYDGTAAAVTVTGLANAVTYYVKVYEYVRCGTAAPFDYYYNVTSGTNVFSFTSPVPPANDNCAGAVSLSVGANFAANAVTGTNSGATASQVAEPSIPAPGCASYLGGDVWYSVTVPSTGNITIETSNSVGSTITDTGLAVYSGPCNALVFVECDDDDSTNGNFSLINLTGREPGSVLYVRVWEYNNDGFGQFQVSAYDCPSATPAPTGAAAQTFCGSATVANLVTTTGTGIKWYTTATLGTALLPTDALVSGNMYYASQTTTPGCEGLARLAVTVTINALPTAPTGAAAQTFCSANSPTLASLTVTGSGLVWYDAATLGNVLPTTTVLTATTYYVASSSNGCFSTRLAITTTNICPVAPCLTAQFGVWPSAAFTPATCNGLVQNNIATDAWASEYSNVSVTTGQTYVFGSSNATDIITVSADGGTTAVATGIGTATWVSTVTGVVRFYTHLAACGGAQVFRTRYIICGIPSLALPDYVNLQFPATASIAQGGNVAVYGQVYEAGLTDVAPNIVGQAPGIQAWVGISTTNTNPNTWTNWIPATWNSGSVGNNDEYQATIGATLVPGTYYYATRFNLDQGAYVYGGINATPPNNGNFWDGATFGSGVLTVTPPPPPANDECSGALPLTVNADYLCGSVTAGTILGATASTVDAAACSGTEDDDVWFSFVATATSHRIALNNVLGSTADLYHSLWTGANCNSLTLVPNSCSDPNTSNPTGLTVGQTYYVRVYSWTATSGQTSTFNVCIGTLPPPPTNDNFATPIAVSCGTVYTGDTSIATLDEDNAPDGFGAALTSANLWYSFTGSGSAQTVTANLCGSSFDTTILVYTGTSGNLTLVAGNDDDSSCVSSGANSKVIFSSNGTTTYYISVSGYGNFNAGVFTMNVTCAAVTPPAVANQDCGTSLLVSVNGLDNNSDNSFGTVSATQPSCDSFGSVQDVWFSFVAPTSGLVTCLVTPTTMTSLNFNIYSGTCGALTPVVNTCNSNLTAAASEVLTGLTPGTTYYVQVWSNSSEQGTFVLRLTDNGLSNADFDNASFSYYPNPVKNTLNLSYSQEISNVEVYNLLGQKVRTVSNNANEVQVDMSNLPRAAYIVKVTSDNQVKTIKVIKE